MFSDAGCTSKNRFYQMGDAKSGKNKYRSLMPLVTSDETWMIQSDMGCLCTDVGLLIVLLIYIIRNLLLLLTVKLHLYALEGWGNVKRFIRKRDASGVLANENHN